MSVGQPESPEPVWGRPLPWENEGFWGSLLCSAPLGWLALECGQTGPWVPSLQGQQLEALECYLHPHPQGRRSGRSQQVLRSDYAPLLVAGAGVRPGSGAPGTQPPAPGGLLAEAAAALSTAWPRPGLGLGSGTCPRSVGGGGHPGGASGQRHSGGAPSNDGVPQAASCASRSLLCPSTSAEPPGLDIYLVHRWRGSRVCPARIQQGAGGPVAPSGGEWRRSAPLRRQSLAEWPSLGGRLGSQRPPLGPRCGENLSPHTRVGRGVLSFRGGSGVVSSRKGPEARESFLLSHARGRPCGDLLGGPQAWGGAEEV